MRRYDIDGLRVIVFGLLIFYHAGVFFVPGSFHSTYPFMESYDWLQYPMFFLNRWRLPLLFVISGMGTFFSISKRSGGGFAKERIVRLFIPLVAGLLFIAPPQVYLERLFKGQFSGNYFEFWPSQAYIGIWPEGNFSWCHLWFLPYLLLFSLVLIPVFLYLLKYPQAWIIRKTRCLAAKRFGLFVPVIPLLLWERFLQPHFPQTNALWGDWYNVVNYGTLFFYGFMLMTIKDVLWENLIKNRRIYLITGTVAYALLMYLWLGIGSFQKKSDIWNIAISVNVWSWILVMISYAAAYLNKPSRQLSYANEAVYPFYILHQPVLLFLAYYLKNVEVSFFAKFSIMAVGTFGISWIIYEFGVRRFAWIRPLFGMKRKKSKINKPSERT